MVCYLIHFQKGRKQLDNIYSKEIKIYLTIVTLPIIGLDPLCKSIK
jgi:hypothetical protein